jgi:hypothetical protein
MFLHQWWFQTPMYDAHGFVVFYDEYHTMDAYRGHVGKISCMRYRICMDMSGQFCARGVLLPGKESPSCRRLGGSQSRSGRGCEEKILTNKCFVVISHIPNPCYMSFQSQTLWFHHLKLIVGLYLVRDSHTSYWLRCDMVLSCIIHSK